MFWNNPGGLSLVGETHLRTNDLSIITGADINLAAREKIVHVTEISC
jgi:hypothetical protein